ncbi:MAG TPA: HAMP domain-containing sensor histidine kinase [Roseomonas sp.]
MPALALILLGPVPSPGARMALHLSLLLALTGCLLLAGLLAAWAERVAGARLLLGFLLGVSLWIAGNALPDWLGPPAIPAALALLATAPLTSAVFLHFALAFTAAPAPRWLPAAGYALGGGAMLLALLLPPGGFAPIAGVGFVAWPNQVGWIAAIIWGAMALAGMLVLLRAGLRAAGPARRQALAVAAASGWGAACMAGYGVLVLRLDAYPWPLLGLPLYPVILVYGVLRYHVLVANAWARRALAWALLAGIAALVLAAVPALTPSGPLLSGALAALAFLALGGPVRGLAERLVYPGGTASAEDLAGWRAALAAAETPAELAGIATRLLSARHRMPIAVALPGAPAVTDPGLPRLACAETASGWRCTLEGWDAAPPGPRHLAGLFGALLAEEAGRLARAGALARRERDLALQARLAELGALAATVAHDIRNPLNIIAMAATAAPAEARAEIRDQLGRVTRLTQDLLDYAKPWRMEPMAIDLAPLAAEAILHHRQAELGPALQAPLPACADPRRLRQALANLLDNAAAAPGMRRMLLDAEAAPGALRLLVCDDGQGVPEALRDSLFQPFVSRSPGGTGLGLAIVAKIAAAHGGGIALEPRPGWSTCFVLTLPQAPP